MADNVSITPGSGASVSTDEKNFGSGPVHVQLVGLVSAVDAETHRMKVQANGSILADLVGVSGGILQTGVDVVKGAAAVQLPSSPLANRKSITIQNMGDTNLRVGSSTTTDSGATRGMVVPPGQSVSLDVGTVAVYGRAAAGGVGANIEVNIVEIA